MTKIERVMEKNPTKINWSRLSYNPNDRALDLLEKNPTEIDWWGLSMNPGLFSR